MATLKTSWQLAAAAGEPHTTIRVRNLQAVVEVGRDAWGRAGKAQPVLISATLSLRAPFDEASAADSVNNKSTVHYGILSKAILEAAESFRTESTGHTTVRALLNHISRHLTGECITIEPVPPAAANPHHPVVDRSVMTSLKLEVLLPKASLIGSGASLSGTTLYASSGACKAYSMSLKLHGLRIPTLIGVNPNERLAKQIVVANVELEPWASDSPSSDSYNEFEEIVVKTIEESSFQTLEALATHIAQRVIKYFLLPRRNTWDGGMHERIKICLEKPTAVTFADAPAVEVLVDSDPNVNSFVERLRNRGVYKRTGPPFPLQGRLDEWIKNNDPED